MLYYAWMSAIASSTVAEMTKSDRVFSGCATTLRHRLLCDRL
ncbi:MAG: hypothetical protein ACHBN1_01755 [Heteroscytonema crispum UTEX LB 1556]